MQAYVKTPTDGAVFPPPRDRVRIQGVATSEPVAGETVLLHFASGQYFGLNQVAARAWAHLSATGSIYAAFERLRAEFDVDDDRLRADLEELVAALESAGLLERGPD